MLCFIVSMGKLLVWEISMRYNVSEWHTCHTYTSHALQKFWVQIINSSGLFSVEIPFGFLPPSICIWLERWHILTSFLWSLWCVSVVTVLFGDSFPSAVSFIIFSFQIGYKLYSRHVAKNLHFDNPVFEQKPLRTSVRQADSRAWDDARRNVRFNCLASMRSFWFVHCVVVLEVIR